MRNHLHAMSGYPRHMVETLRLKDGRRLLLRPLLPQDWRGLKQGFEKLSPEDRRLRFLGGLSQLSEAAARRLCTLDFRREMALVLFDLSKEPPEGVGIVRMAQRSEEEVGEIAIVLLAPWRRYGLGRLMLQRLISWAGARGLARLRALMLPENTAMLSLAKSLGFHAAPSPEGPGLKCAELDLAATDDGGRVG